MSLHCFVVLRFIISTGVMGRATDLYWAHLAGVSVGVKMKLAEGLRWGRIKHSSLSTIPLAPGDIEDFAAVYGLLLIVS